nr:uncharacterized protein LOC108947408 [Nicotiana tomentosiformis]
MEAGLGGVFRNSNGDWILDFHKSCHAASVMQAELMALQEGLKLAKEMNFPKMKIETDSTKIIKLIYDDNQYLSNTILDRRLLMQQPKLSALRHNFRERNEVAHLLAKEVVKHFIPTKYFYHARPPPFVDLELNRNKQEISKSIKYLPTFVCNSLATLDNSNVLRDYVLTM